MYLELLELDDSIVHFTFDFNLQSSLYVLIQRPNPVTTPAGMSSVDDALPIPATDLHPKILFEIWLNA